MDLGKVSHLKLFWPSGFNWGTDWRLLKIILDAEFAMSQLWFRPWHKVIWWSFNATTFFILTAGVSGITLAIFLPTVVHIALKTHTTSLLLMDTPISKPTSTSPMERLWFSYHNNSYAVRFLPRCLPRKRSMPALYIAS